MAYPCCFQCAINKFYRGHLYKSARIGIKPLTIGVWFNFEMCFSAGVSEIKYISFISGYYHITTGSTWLIIFPVRWLI